MFAEIVEETSPAQTFTQCLLKVVFAGVGGGVIGISPRNAGADPE